MPDDAFSLLGLSPRFDLDPAELHRRFIAASAANHPDRHTDPLEQADAADRSASVNAAYRALRDPESRAHVLLQRLGGAAGSTGAAGSVGDEKALPPDLLMEMLEARERHEEAKAAGDTATLHELNAWARAEHDARLKKVADLFAAALARNAPDPAAAGAIRMELNAIRYFTRMIEQAG